MGFYGQWIRSAREQRGLTLKEAAGAAGMSMDGLSRIERNVNGATISTLESLARVYRCEIGDLFPRTEKQIAVPDEVRTLLASMAYLPNDVKDTMFRSWTQQAMAFAGMVGNVNLSLETGESRSYSSALPEIDIDDATLQQDGDAFAPVPRRGVASTGAKGVRKRGD